MIEVTKNGSGMYIRLPPGAWTDDDKRAVYDAFKKGHGISFDDRYNERDTRMFVNQWNREGRLHVDHRPYLGGKFFASDAGQCVRTHGYCDPSIDESEHNREFLRIVQEYFMRREA